MMNDKELADLDGTDPPERDDWITDVDATIHNLMGDDGENDDTNDWVHDVACALWRQVGLRDLARIRELSAEVENLSITAEAALREVERLRAAGNEMMKHVAAVVEYDRIGPTYTSHPAVVAWRAALGEAS